MAALVHAMIALLAATLGSMLPAASAAQPYPGKTIRYIVPFVPGGATDTLARVIAQKLNAAWGVSVVVENRPGAGGNLGTELVARSAPDGHTLLMAINSHAVNASLYSKLNYDPIKDFAPVSLVATSPNVVVVHPSLPAKTVKELIAFARTRPGELTYGTAGPGSGAHLAGELFKSMARVDLIHVPYKGAGQVVIDLIGGQVSMSFIALPVVYPHVRAGKLRVLAVTSATRSPLVPDLPTVAESGLPGFEVVSWFGTLAPAGTSRDIVTKLNSEISKILQMPDVKEKMGGLGLELRGGTPEQFGRFIKSDWALWDKVIKSVGIRLD
ncbi:MAG: tripartite tricarboxylate transporter substrate binding protein [Betaproteobacteria bacterium]|nr:tripartite tricarboxylate transporter substrate binding protein [Betaproteobacteria bacterium]